MLNRAAKSIFCRGLGENFTAGCTKGTAKNCESRRFTGEINCLRALGTEVFKIFRSATWSSGGFSGASGKIILLTGGGAGTLTGGVANGAAITGVKSFSFCSADFAHSDVSECLSVRTSRAGGGVRGLGSPGLQKGSARLHVARQDVDAHHAHTCLYLQEVCLFSLGQLRPLITRERQISGNLLLKEASLTSCAAV